MIAWTVVFIIAVGVVVLSSLREQRDGRPVLSEIDPLPLDAHLCLKMEAARHYCYENGLTPCYTAESRGGMIDQNDAAYSRMLFVAEVTERALARNAMARRGVTESGKIQ